MARINARLRRGPYPKLVADHYANAIQHMEQAALVATDKATTEVQSEIRGSMKAARLGRLGNAIGKTSDLKRGRGVKRYPGGGFSASGVLFLRSKSERTLGAMEAYTEGAEITPVRSPYLWIATDEIPKFAGKKRMTPKLYRQGGFEQKIGKLTQIRSVDGTPLLVARNVGVNAAGKPRSAKSLTKAGRPRKGQRLKEFVVAFIGIPRTSRAARVNVRQMLQWKQADLAKMWEAEMQRRVRK